MISPAAQIDAIDSQIRQLRSSILHHAVIYNKMGLCRQLVEEGLATTQDDALDTPVHTAIRVNNVAAFVVLLRSEPNLLKTNKDDETPFELACRLGNVRCLRLLLLAQPSIDQLIPPSRKYTALASLPRQLQKLAAKCCFATPPGRQFVCQFSNNPYDDISTWVDNIRIDAQALKFSLPDFHWSNVLYHVLGDKALSYIENQTTINNGSHIAHMYVVLLWTWRIFWQNVPSTQESLFIGIDRAIGSLLRETSPKSLASRIKRGKEPVILNTGTTRHSLTVVFINSLMFICNRGRSHAPQKYMLTAYRIRKCTVTENLVATILNFVETSELEKVSEFLFTTLPAALGAKTDTFCEAINSQCQPKELYKPICVAANFRLAVRALLLAESKKVGDGWDFETSMQVYKQYVTCARTVTLLRYHKPM